MNKILVLFALILGLVSCKTYNDEDLESFDKQISTYLDKKGIKCVKTDSGLYYKILEPGKGEFILFQDSVSFTYKGSFLDGEVFDNQRQPVQFAVKDLIAAWKEVMLELKPGAKVFLVTPPSLAYGAHELDDIPPNSILVFEMEVKGVK